MKRTISAIEARRNLGELLEGVFYRGDEIIVERAGKPMAMLVPIERYQKVIEAHERFWTTLTTMWAGPPLSEEEAEALALEAVAWARAEKRSKSKKPA